MFIELPCYVTHDRELSGDFCQLLQGSLDGWFFRRRAGVICPFMIPGLYQQWRHFNMALHAQVGAYTEGLVCAIFAAHQAGTAWGE